MFPLFYYYSNIRSCNIFVYSPMTKKSIYLRHGKYSYNDYRNFNINIILAELFTKRKPYFLEKEHIKYLKSVKKNNKKKTH